MASKIVPMIRRRHAAHTAVNELIRPLTLRVQVTKAVGYNVTAPCLLAQLRDAVAVGEERGRQGGAPGPRLPISPDALDLWGVVVFKAGLWINTWNTLNARGPLVSIADPTPGNAIPWVGRQLRMLVDHMEAAQWLDTLDNVWSSASEWAARIEGLLGGRPAVRAVRGAVCPTCKRDRMTENVIEDEVSMTYTVPTILLTEQGARRTARCRNCGWSLDLGGSA